MNRSNEVRPVVTFRVRSALDATRASYRSQTHHCGGRLVVVGARARRGGVPPYREGSWLTPHCRFVSGDASERWLRADAKSRSEG